MDSIPLCLFIFISGFVFQVIAKCENKPNVITAGDRHAVSTWLLKNAKKCDISQIEYPSFDGWFHNLAKRELGSVEQNLVRGWAGITVNAFQVKKWSNAWMEARSKISMCRPTNNALSLFFGKQVANEILNTGSKPCAEGHDLDHQHYATNYASAYIDGGIIYGISRYGAAKHISPKDGTISIDNSVFRDDDVYLEILRMIWVRWHNIMAHELHKACPTWSSAKIFNEARKFTIATQQRIYFYEWLPEWTGKPLAPYHRYDPLVNPEVETIFQAAVYLPQSLSEHHCNINSCKKLRHANGWNYDSLLNMMQNLVAEPCRKYEKYEDANEMVQNYGLPDINHARKAFNLTSYSTWQEFAQAHNVADSMLVSKFVDKSLKQLDSLLGGALESKSGSGELFVEVIHDQFRRIRDGDRFWFENRQNILFSEDEVCKINKISFADIFLTVTGIINGNFGNQSAFRQYKATNFTLLKDLDGTYVYNINKIEKQRGTAFKFRLIIFSVILSYCFVIAAITICLIIRQKGLTKLHFKQENQKIKTHVLEAWKIKYPLFLAQLYDGTDGPKKRVVLVLDKQSKQIIAHSTSGTILRTVGFENRSKAEIKIINISNEPTAILKSANNYDLVLKFHSKSMLNSFLTELDHFLIQTMKEKKPTPINLKWQEAIKQLLTKQRHQVLLEMFFRVAFAQAFKIEHSLEEMLDVDTSVAAEVVYTELTMLEFAECLSMSPEHEFVKNTFALVDRDKKGVICFRAFLDFIILFASGKEEVKANLLFKLYDIDGTALLPNKEFKTMLSSLIEIAGDTSHSAQRMLKQADLEHKERLDFDDFKKVIGQLRNKLSRATLDAHKSFPKEHSYLSMARQTLQSMYSCPGSATTVTKNNMPVIDKEQENVIKPPERRTFLQKTLYFCESYSKQLFWFSFITLVILYVFMDRICHFYIATKLTGIDRYMFAISKGSTYGIVLTYSLLCITMCRNISTNLRDTFLNRYFPFHNFEEIHFYLSYLSAVFTLLHVVGETHLFLWFMVSFFEKGCKVQHVDQEIKNIVEFKWINPIVISGLILLLLLMFIYTFAQAGIRLRLHRLFYFTHNLYPLVLILLVIHGSLSQWSLLYALLSGPLTIFLLDSFIGISTGKITIPVLQAEFLPSDVICLILKRPQNFQYEVGQWVRLAIHQINSKEFHRFILSSTPFEPHLRIYVLPTDRCAQNLRTLAEVPQKENTPAQIRVFLDGPYGNGLQQWRTYDVTILIGGGSDIALFTSVLKDIIYILQSKTATSCKKVYFIWTSKTQKHFEWIVDLIREVEDNDQKQFFSGHLFITGFYEKFDLRTILMNICEIHYQRISEKSIFTGLKSRIHFGKPNIRKLFETIQSLHETANTVGVFCSGPVSLERTVDASCNEINLRSDQRFEHRSFNKD